MQYYFVCDHTTGCEGYSFTTDGHGIFIVLEHLGACRTRKDSGEVGGGSRSDTNKSAQELIADSEGGGGGAVLKAPCPARGSNPGSSN